MLKYLILCLIAVIVFPLLYFFRLSKESQEVDFQRYRLRIFNRSSWTYYAR